MTAVSVLPVSGDVFNDARGMDGDSGRTLRISWHPQQDLTVLSIWRGGICVATFQLRRDEIPQLVHSLVAGLA